VRPLARFDIAITGRVSTISRQTRDSSKPAIHPNPRFIQTRDPPLASPRPARFHPMTPRSRFVVVLRCSCSWLGALPLLACRAA
jgi:hypothetical protein